MGAKGGQHVGQPIFVILPDVAREFARARMVAGEIGRKGEYFAAVAENLQGGEESLSEFRRGELGRFRTFRKI